MKKLKIMVASLLAMAMPLVAGCVDPGAPGTGTGTGGQTQVTPKVKSVSISGNNTVKAGGQVTLTANVSVSGSAPKTVTWKSSKTDIATISSSGVVTGVSVGTTTITCTSTFDTSKSATLTLTVTEAKWEDDEVTMFEDYLGTTIPYFNVPVSDSWTDYYYEDYGCLSVEIEGTNALTTMVNSIKANDDYTLVYEDDGGYSFTAEIEGDDFYLICLDAYVDDYGYSVIDAYLGLIEYDAWPTTVLNNLLTEIEIDADVPSFAEEDAVFTISPAYLDEEGEEACADIYAYCDSESSTTSASYIAKLDEQDYLVFEIEGGYQAQAKDASHTLYVLDIMNEEIEMYYIYYAFGAITEEEFEEYTGITVEEAEDESNWYLPGFELIIAPYQADYSLAINENYEMVAVNDTLTLTLIKGLDIPSEATINFETSDETIATVGTNGVVTGVAAGEVTITATYGDKATASTTVYVVDSIAEAWTTTQQEEINKIHNLSGIEVPFNKYFDTVEYDTENEYVLFSGKTITFDMLVEYYEAFETAGWTSLDADFIQDLIDNYEYTEAEAFAEAYYYGNGFFFEKKFTLNESDYYISAQLILIEEEDGEQYITDQVGMLTAIVYDQYVYSNADAMDLVASLYEDAGIETESTIPTLEGTHYCVYFDEGYNDICLEVYGLNKTLSEVKDMFVNDTYKFTGEIITLTADDTEDEFSYLVLMSENEDLKIEVYESDNCLLFCFGKPISSGDQITSTSQMYDGMEVVFYCEEAEAYIGAYNGKKNFGEAFDITDATVFVLTDNGDGTWAIADTEGNEYGSDSSKNVKTSGSNVCFDWTIGFSATGDATIDSVDYGWTLMYNKDASVFKTYASDYSEGATIQMYIA